MAYNRDLDKARGAFKKKDIDAMITAHQQPPEQHQQSSGRYIKHVVYGGLDGIITTFAVAAGVTGAKLAVGILLILGLVNLFGDGLSMGLGDYLSSKSEIEYQHRERDRESWEVEHYPEGEKMELVGIYQNKGLSQEDAATLVKLISKTQKPWVDIMMVEELGIVETNESPRNNAAVTFVSFAAFGAIPILTYVLALLEPGWTSQTGIPFIWTCIFTAITLFVLGAAKTKVTGKSALRSGLETLIVGGIAASVAFLIGFTLNGLVTLLQ
jgi:VIT1/CCC1 family predicted Fe2+/Mn2+ transporter